MLHAHLDMAFGTLIHQRVPSQGTLGSDFVGSIDDRKITYGYALHLGTNLISWTSQKQPIVSMSSAEAEYVTKTTTG